MKAPIMFHGSSDKTSVIENSVANCSPTIIHDAEVSELAGLACCTESSIMKSEIFDPAYDMHQMIAASSDDNMLFLSSMDTINGLSLNMENETGFKPTSPVKTERTLDNFAVPQNRLSSTGTGEGFGIFDGSAVVESVLCPNINFGATNSTEIGAQLSKVEAGADDKGYILHLNTGVRNFTVSVDGTVVSQAWPDSAGDTQIMSDESAMCCAVGKTDKEDDPCSSDLGQHDFCTIKHEPGCDNGSEMQVTKVFFPYGEKDDKTHIRLLDTGLMSHLGSTEVTHDSRDSDDSLDSGRLEHNDTDVTDDASPQQKLDQMFVDIERFVICSDGPMECLLCLFNTDNYSTFKSHIICSHPCWRITKKLSKNRLLVEKSARVNLTTSPVSLSTKSARISLASTLPLTAKSVGNRRKKKVKDQVAKQLNKLCQQNARSRQLTQRNKRIFRCGKCQRLFVFEGSIVNHLLDYHDVRKPYKHIEVSNDHGETFSAIHRCMQRNCFVSCGSKLELEKHTREAHDLVFRCQICGFCAESTEAVERHVLNIHNQQLMMYGLSE